MNYLDQFKIQHKGIKDGVKNYSFSVDKEFFACFESSEIKKGNVEIAVKLTKRPEMMVFEFELNGTTQAMCDRCLDSMEMHIHNSEVLYVKYGAMEADESDNVLAITQDTNYIDLSQYIYDYIILALPVKRMHQHTDDCNQEMLKKLDQHKIDREDSIDPRLKKLKDLLTKK